MKQFIISDKLNRSINMLGLQIKKHSPEILLVAGVVGVVTSAVMACKATTKVNDVLANAKEQTDKVHQVLADETITEEQYTEEDGKKDLAIIYAQTGLNLVKLYGPAVILGGLSIASILASNNILRKRNVALAASYMAVDSSFKEYRNRVIERFGENMDRELRYDIKAEEVEVTTTDENGNEVKTTEVVEVVRHTPSGYEKCFDECNPNWTKDPDINWCFIKNVQNYANDSLKREGFLFLNDIYAMLGFPKTREGQLVGWIYDEKNPDHMGDNFIDFGLYDLKNKEAHAFVNGYERSVWLDFNVDGPIYNRI